jgi:hypothetical protein
MFSSIRRIVKPAMPGGADYLHHRVYRSRASLRTPMRVFARRIKRALDVPIERSQHADARMHQRPAIFRRHQ